MPEDFEMGNDPILSPAPEKAPAPAQIRAGLSLVVDISPGFSPLKQGLANVWEDVSEDIADLLIKRIVRRDGLGVKSTSQFTDRGFIKLTLSLTSDA